MTAPIAPDDIEGLAKITARYTAKGWTSEIGLMIASSCASAVARAVCPPGFVVVSTDDLRAVLDHGIIGWQSGPLNPHEAYDRLRAKVGETP